MQKISTQQEAECGVEGEWAARGDGRPTTLGELSSAIHPPRPSCCRTENQEREWEGLGFWGRRKVGSTPGDTNMIHFWILLFSCAVWTWTFLLFENKVANWDYAEPTASDLHVLACSPWGLKWIWLLLDTLETLDEWSQMSVRTVEVKLQRKDTNY